MRRGSRCAGGSRALEVAVVVNIAQPRKQGVRGRAQRERALQHPIEAISAIEVGAVAVPDAFAVAIVKQHNIVVVITPACRDHINVSVVVEVASMGDENADPASMIRR